MDFSRYCSRGLLMAGLQRLERLAGFSQAPAAALSASAPPIGHRPL
jgi:hypothetical protein